MPCFHLINILPQVGISVILDLEQIRGGVPGVIVHHCQHIFEAPYSALKRPHEIDMSSKQNFRSSMIWIRYLW